MAGALADAGFLAVGLATATAMAGPAAKGRAASVLLGGITLACVAGVPAPRPGGAGSRDDRRRRGRPDR